MGSFVNATPGRPLFYIYRILPYQSVEGTIFNTSRWTPGILISSDKTKPVGSPDCRVCADAFEALRAYSVNFL